MVNLSPAQLAPAQPNSSDSDLCLIPPAPVTPVSAILTNHLTSVASKGFTGNLTPLSATLTKNRGEGAPRPPASCFSLLACSDPVRDPLGTPSYLALFQGTRITSFCSPPATRHFHSPLPPHSPSVLRCHLQTARPRAKQAQRSILFSRLSPTELLRKGRVSPEGTKAEQPSSGASGTSATQPFNGCQQSQLPCSHQSKGTEQAHAR